MSCALFLTLTCCTKSLGYYKSGSPGGIVLIIVKLDNVRNNILITRPTPGVSVQTPRRNCFRSHSKEAPIPTRIYICFDNLTLRPHHEEKDSRIDGGTVPDIDQVLVFLNNKWYE